MRKLVMFGLLAVASLLSAGESRGYGNGPWCAIINLGGGVVQENCSMPNFEVCRQEAMRFGSTSFCRHNGYWTGGDEQPRRPRKYRRTHRG